MRRIPVIVIALIFTSWGCDRSGSSQPSPTGEEQPAPTKTPPTEAGHDDHDGHEDHEEENVAEEQNRATSLASEETVGQAPSAEVSLVAATDLLANPQQHAGQTVRFEGTVKGFCVHARAWYAVDVPGATPPYVRVLTAPAFRVPEGVMNARVVTQGVVEVQTMPASRITHFEEHHQLGSGNEPPGVAEVTRVIIRATGATFSPAS